MALSHGSTENFFGRLRDFENHSVSNRITCPALLPIPFQLIRHLLNAQLSIKTSLQRNMQLGEMRERARRDKKGYSGPGLSRMGKVGEEVEAELELMINAQTNVCVKVTFPS